MSYRSVAECSKKVIDWLIGEEPDKWFSTSTLVEWHKDVAAIHINQNCLEATKSKFFAYGIIADESTRGDQKIFVICFMFWNYIANSPNIVLLDLEDLKECNGESVATSVTNTCKKYNIDPQLCLAWRTDNTAYMSGKQDGAVAIWKAYSGDRIFKSKISIQSFTFSLTTPRRIQRKQLGQSNEYENGELKLLPAGRRAHEIPDAILQWIQDEEFALLVNNLIYGVEKALSSFQTWMENWMRLPLSLCRLEAIMEEDIDNNSEFNDFGLSLTLKDSKFCDEFLHFAKSLKRQVYEYSLLGD
ncbi:11687_t:CDS:2 [Ambispora leptoticha]|uniref:11687_t:CDS:1 n=1 Tax=Ambispora leptoticha TaxID=144679 RepID=A0A9N9AQ05_9GLOM|nr:11687_t:CDS:2 [Ambispora leptoticha]